MTPAEIMNRFFYRKNPFAVKTSSGFYVPVYRDVTLADIQKHLNGGHTIGAYQSRSDETCMWTCIDFDSHEYEKVAKEITKEFKDEPLLRDVLFESSESKGFHVWFFFENVLKTQDAYSFIKAVLTAFDLKEGRDTKIDIFPRSPHLSGKRVGWLVRVPR